MPRLAIFTDFDGTLVNLADTPGDVTVPADLAAQLVDARSALGGAMAVVSGRALADLDRYLPAELPAAGGHGTERRRADGTVVGPNGAFVDTVDHIIALLQPLADAHAGLLLERKPAAVALHYRRTPALAETCRAAMHEALAGREDFELLDGKMVVEARPAGISKADAIRDFMLEEPFVGRVPVFFGDDATDEDGFRACQDVGGVGVKVGPGESLARTRVADVEAARATILGLAARMAEEAR